MASLKARAEWGRLLALFILATGIRLLYVLSLPSDSPVGSVDAWGYHRLALNVAERNGFSLRSQSPFVPDSVRTPLYPGFLLLIRRTLGPAPRTAALVQALLDGCTTLLIWQLATRLGGPRAGRVAALLYALNPTQVRYVNDLLTETLLSFLLTLCMCLLVRYIQTGRSTHPHGQLQVGRLLLIAILAGLAALCKPNMQFLPLSWLPAMALVHKRDWRRGLIAVGIMTLVFICMLIPWIGRNHLLLGRPLLSTALEGNISRVSAPATLAFARKQSWAPWSAEWEAIFAEIVSQAAEQYRWGKPWDTLTARELDTYNHQVYLVARQVIRQHPIAWMLSHLQGLARYLEPQTFRTCYALFSGREWPPDILDDVVIHTVRAAGRGDWREAWRIITEERWTKLNVLQGMVWWGTFAGQIIGLGLLFLGAHRLRHQPALVALLLLTIGYVLSIPGPIAYERFRVPVMSLILALIGVAATDHRHSIAVAFRSSIDQVQRTFYGLCDRNMT